jgi:hypothetical protein
MPPFVAQTRSASALNSEATPGRIRASLTSPRGGEIRGVVEEMSPSDLRLFLDAPLQIGTLVNVRLTPEGWSSQFEACGVVHRSELLGGGADIGIFLSERLSDDLIAACWLEMRREVRYPVVWSVWARSEMHRKIIPATVLNYSYSGVQLRITHVARLGEQLTLMTDGPITTSTVRWAAAMSGSDLICGCEIPKSDGLKLSLRIQHPSPTRARRT